MFIHKSKAIRRLPCCWRRCPHRLFSQTLELFYSIGTFCISLEFYTESEYLNNVFRTLGSTKNLNDICLTYTLRSKSVKFNQTFIQPNPNVPETFFVSWDGCTNMYPVSIVTPNDNFGDSYPHRFNRYAFACSQIKKTLIF